MSSIAWPQQDGILENESAQDSTVYPQLNFTQQLQLLKDLSLHRKQALMCAMKDSICARFQNDKGSMRKAACLPAELSPQLDGQLLKQA